MNSVCVMYRAVFEEGLVTDPFRAARASEETIPENNDEDT